MAYSFIAWLILLALFWWVWHPLGAAVAIVAAGRLRIPVINRAAFWGTKTILSVGILWGLGMAVLVWMIVAAATSSRLLAVLLFVEGLIAVQYVGFEPSPEDHFNKAGQTATVGVICYLVATGVGFLLRGWPH